MTRTCTILIVFFFMVQCLYAFGGVEAPQCAVYGNNSFDVWARHLTHFEDEKKLKSHSSLAPDYVHFQYLKKAGQLSAGAGYRIHNIYEPSLLIGYMYKPMKLKNGRASVITLKNSFILLGPRIMERMAIKSGVSVNFLLEDAIPGKITFYHRAMFYFQERIYSMPFISGEWYFNRQRRKSSLFVEVSTVDSAIRDAVDSEFVQFDEIWGLSIGLTFYLH